MQRPERRRACTAPTMQTARLRAGTQRVQAQSAAEQQAQLVGWSHNRGLAAGRLLASTMAYQYNPRTDEYRSCFQRGRLGQGGSGLWLRAKESVPRELDVNNGRLYYHIMPGGSGPQIAGELAGIRNRGTTPTTGRSLRLRVPFRTSRGNIK